MNTQEECQWCHGNPCTCPHGWPEAPLEISESDLRGVFGHKCDQPNCPVCHPNMSLTELAELYERAATPKPARPEPQEKET